MIYFYFVICYYIHSVLFCAYKNWQSVGSAFSFLSIAPLLLLLAFFCTFFFLYSFYKRLLNVSKVELTRVCQIHTLYISDVRMPTNQQTWTIHERERNISWAANSFSTFDTNVRLQQTYRHCLTLFASKYRCELDSIFFFHYYCSHFFSLLHESAKRILFNQKKKKTFDNYRISMLSCKNLNSLGPLDRLINREYNFHILHIRDTKTEK